MSAQERRRRGRPHALPVRLDQRRRHRRPAARCSSSRSITLSGVIVLHRALLVGTFDTTQAQAARLPAAADALRPARAAGAGDRRLVRDRRQPARVRLPDRAAVDGVVAGDARAAGDGHRRRRSAPSAPWSACLISYHHATATGATMALVTVIVFLAALLARQIVSGGWRRSTPVSLPAWLTLGSRELSIADSVIDLIGHTPLVRMKRTMELERLPGRAGDEDGDHQPRGFLEGPTGAGDDPRRRARRRVAAGRHDRRAHQRQHRRRVGDRRRPARRTTACSS